MGINVLTEEYKKELKDNIFYDEEERLEKLHRSHNRKLELLELKSGSQISTPFVVEFTGTPRSGKTSCVKNVNDFFKKGGFRIELLEEPANQINTRIKNQNDLKNMGDREFNDLTLQIALDSLAKIKNSDFDIILMDRGILDNYVWYDMFYKQKIITEEEYKRYFEIELYRYKSLVDMLDIILVDERTALRRDYLNSITLEPRRKITFEKLTAFNSSLIDLASCFSAIVDNVHTINTTQTSILDTSITIAENIMNGYEQKLSLLNKK